MVKIVFSGSLVGSPCAGFFEGDAILCTPLSYLTLGSVLVEGTKCVEDMLAVGVHEEDPLDIASHVPR